jgi:hypothetical protein
MTRNAKIRYVLGSKRKARSAKLRQRASKILATNYAACEAIVPSLPRLR